MLTAPWGARAAQKLPVQKLKRIFGTLLLVIAGVLAGAGWIFSSLTIEVTQSELTWFFGPGLWRKFAPRGEIVGAVRRAVPAHVPVSAKMRLGNDVTREDAESALDVMRFALGAEEVSTRRAEHEAEAQRRRRKCKGLPAGENLSYTADRPYSQSQPSIRRCH